MYKEIDFQPWLEKKGFGVLEALRDKAYFAQVELDPVLGTIIWPNGADFCPDVLYAYPRPVEIDVTDDALAVDPGSDATLAPELPALRELTHICSQIREQRDEYHSDLLDEAQTEREQEKDEIEQEQD
jgi:hypothetical protein